MTQLATEELRLRLSGLLRSKEPGAYCLVGPPLSGKSTEVRLACFKPSVTSSENAGATHSLELPLYFDLEREPRDSLRRLLRERVGFDLPLGVNSPAAAAAGLLSPTIIVDGLEDVDTARARSVCREAARLGRSGYRIFVVFNQRSSPQLELIKNLLFRPTDYEDIFPADWYLMSPSFGSRQCLSTPSMPSPTERSGMLMAAFGGNLLANSIARDILQSGISSATVDSLVRMTLIELIGFHLFTLNSREKRVFQVLVVIAKAGASGLSPEELQHQVGLSLHETPDDAIVKVRRLAAEYLCEYRGRLSVGHKAVRRAILNHTENTDLPEPLTVPSAKDDVGRDPHDHDEDPAGGAAQIGEHELECPTEEGREVIGNHFGWVWDIAAVGGKDIVSAGDDGEICLWNSSTGTLRNLYLNHSGSVNAVTTFVLHDRAMCASGGQDAAIRIWGSQDVQDYRIVTVHDGPVVSLCADQNFSRSQIISGSVDGTIAISDADTGMVVGRTRTVGGAPTKIRMISRSGSKQILSGCDDGILRTWNPWSSFLISETPAHVGSIASLGVTSDSRYVLTGGRDGWLRCWSSKTLGLVASVAVSSDWVRAIAVGCIDGIDMVVSGSDDGRVCIYRLPDLSLASDTKVSNWPISSLLLDTSDTNDRPILYIAGFDSKVRRSTVARLGANLVGANGPMSPNAEAS